MFDHKFGKGVRGNMEIIIPQRIRENPSMLSSVPLKSACSFPRVWTTSYPADVIAPIEEEVYQEMWRPLCVEEVPLIHEALVKEKKKYPQFSLKGIQWGALFAANWVTDQVAHKINGVYVPRPLTTDQNDNEVYYKNSDPLSVLEGRDYPLLHVGMRITPELTTFRLTVNADLEQQNVNWTRTNFAGPALVFSASVPTKEI